MALEAELRRLGIKGLAIMELDVRAQLDRYGLAVGRGLVRQRQLRHEVELLVDVEELVADRGKHDPTDIGSRHGRVEQVGIFGQADTQGALRGGRRDAGAAQGQCEKGGLQELGFECHGVGLVGWRGVRRS